MSYSFHLFLADTTLSQFEDELGEIHIQSLEGLGASYRLKGFFKVRINGAKKKVNFKGVAFGGHYGGHNVNIEISEASKKMLEKDIVFRGKGKIDALLSEVQRKILNGDMTVEFDKLREGDGSQGGNLDPFGNIAA